MGFEEGGAKAVMASYNAWNGTTMAVNPILKSILRDKWGVDVLSSDGGAVSAMVYARHQFPDQKAAVVACLKAGINQFLDKYEDETKAARERWRGHRGGDRRAAAPEVPGHDPARDCSIRRRWCRTRRSRTHPSRGIPMRIATVSKQMALESVVLLKNENALLPLKKNAIKSIAVIGPLADSVHWDWYGGTPPYAVTPLQGIKDEVGPDVKVNYAASELGHAAFDAAKSSDVAVVIVGNDPTCGPDMPQDWAQTVDGGGTLACTVPSDGREGRDRESITLEQEQLVKQVYAANPKTIVILVSSFPYAINWSQAHVPAILHMTHSSQDEGTALAKVLFGEYNPGGHLTVTWPKSIDQLPPMMDYNIRDGRTYMYFKGEPLYPFGFGLSYTSFKYSNLRTSSPKLANDGAVTVSVDVTNTGAVAGDAVVQLYVKHLASKVSRPNEELKGFKRVGIKPGETKTVEIPLKAASLAWWDEKLPGFRVEAEPVRLMVGNSSSDIQLDLRSSRIQCAVEPVWSSALATFGTGKKVAILAKNSRFLAKKRAKMHGFFGYSSVNNKNLNYLLCDSYKRFMG